MGDRSAEDKCSLSSPELVYATWQPEIGVYLTMVQDGEIVRSRALGRSQIKNLVEILLKGL